MARPILHMLFTGRHASPFDVNMAVDAGFDIVQTYTEVETNEVEALVQDCIFSRKPKSHGATALYVGGRDVNRAEDMLAAAQKAMFDPFRAGLMADPNGAYTTSAALVALVCAAFEGNGGALGGARVAIVGGGPVGLASGVLLAREGADVTIGHPTESGDAQRGEVQRFAERFDVTLAQAGIAEGAPRRALLGAADIVIAAAKAGVEVVSLAQLEGARARVLADVNAVPPAGIESVGAQDDGAAVDALPGAVAFGALAVGGVKYKTQSQLLRSLIGAETALRLGLPEAYAAARAIVAARA